MPGRDAIRDASRVVSEPSTPSAVAAGAASVTLVECSSGLLGVDPPDAASGRADGLIGLPDPEPASAPSTMNSASMVFPVGSMRRTALIEVKRDTCRFCVFRLILNTDSGGR